MARIIFLGRLGDLTQGAEGERDLPDDMRDTQALRIWLDATLELNGALLDKSVRLAVNNDIVIDPHPVRNTDEIAFLPPVGGG